MAKTKEELKAIAKAVAEKAAMKMFNAYVQSVERHSDDYDEYDPTDEDFMAWLEGYDWED